MSNIVLTVSQSTLLNMKEHYKSSLQSKVPQGGIFMAKPNGCTITAYKSGKVMFQGSNCEIEVNKWEGKSAISAPKKTNVSSSSLPANFSELAVIGSDEVGTGDYFGPMAVVASFVEPSQFELLKELGVKDSKELNDAEISKIAKKILHVVPYSLLVLHNEKYNEMQEKGNNMNKLKALLHNQAIRNIIKKLEGKNYDSILIDQFTPPNLYYSYLKNTKEVIRDKVQFATKAEGLHLSVAVSSILARYAFLQQMDLLSEKAGMTLPKGAGAKVDQVAANFIKLKGFDALRSFTKLHFANTEKALKIAKK
ncbi:ribonuclease HIII [Bacillus sp. EAC]|uniref:ribonuclease HIII n=1 Tax=Bacillus sp. EAC TaxID=1978338 RepID=UPI000B4479D7|nr:ribonuclease HIII [Bacillus sp. EAC]